MAIYANRGNISLIKAVRGSWGMERSAQTNSRRNGNYVKHIALYLEAGDKGHPERAKFLFRTLRELRCWLEEE